MRFPKPKLILALAGGLAALAAAVWLLLPGRGWGGLRRGRDLNVILITLDTTRADRLPSYGFTAVDTPTLDRFAAEGVRFERCMAQTPLTLPAHTSILTGTFPPFHGVRDNGGFIVPPALTTMAEVFKTRDYQTSAFVAAYVLDSKWGLDQGFDLYHDKFDLSRFETISLGVVQRPANEVMDEALGWLETAKAGKFFSWIHLYDPHTPYEPPPPFDKKYRHPYLGEIAFMDSQLARLWEFLETNGLRKNTVIVVAGDHGESLGAHQESSHGFFVYQEAVHVPLIVVTPYAKLRGVVVPPVVTLADILPTVCDMTGFEAPRETQGVSLLPLFFKPEREVPGVGEAYSETYYPRYHYGWSELKSFQDRRFKLILAPELELYDLEKDPRETANLAESEPAAARDLLARANRFLETVGRNALSVDLSRMDEETKQRLAALGYVGSFTDPVKLEGRRLINPKSKIGIFNSLARAREMGMEGKTDEAARAIRDIIAADPEIVDAHFSLGNVLFKARRFAEALDAFRQALKLKPDDSFTVINMSNCLMGLGRPEEAESLILGFLRQGFKDSQLYHMLGTLAYARKAYDRALDYFEQCLTINSESAASHSSMAAIYIVTGDLAKAEAHLAEAVKTNPTLHNLYFNWAQLHEKAGRPEEAAAAYRQELKNSARSFRAAFNLARIHRQAGREEDERTWLEKTRELNPEFPLTYFYLARIELNRGGDYREAVALVEKGLELRPEPSDRPLGYFLLADLYNRLGEEARSLEYARKGQEAARAVAPER
jgi:arylsulfatase A-like enzyme/predicted Zn-dependent protease